MLPSSFEPDDLLLEGEESFSSKELTTFRVFGWLVISLLFLNTGLLAWNIARYLIPLRVKSIQLSLFYVLAALVLISRIIELLYLVWPKN